MRRTAALLLGPGLAVALSGCGLLTKDIDTTVSFDHLDIASLGSTYDAILRYDPNQVDDVRNNRDKIKTGQIMSIDLVIKQVLDGNKAQFIGGHVDVKRSIDPESSYQRAVGSYEAIPLYADLGTPKTSPVPVSDQQYDLALSTRTLGNIKTLVFSIPNEDKYDCTPCGDPSKGTCPKGCIDLHVIGGGFNYAVTGTIATGPVQLTGKVDVNIRVTVSE